MTDKSVKKEHRLQESKKRAKNKKALLRGGLKEKLNLRKIKKPPREGAKI